MSLLSWTVKNIKRWDCNSVIVETGHGPDFCHPNKIPSGAEFVTADQWMAAKEAACNTEWDGDGLPPVGCECEIKRVADWMPVTIKFISDYHTVFTTFGGTEDCYQTCSLQFRPIRSEADKKRDEAVVELSSVIDYRNGCSSKPLAGWLYDTIAAGKIPHVHIE